jgi:predicted nucleic acid-binding protein
VKLYVEEDGSERIREITGLARVIATSAIAYVEARAAFSRKRHAGGLPPSDHRRVVGDLDRDWPHYLRVHVADSLLHSAAALTEAHRLRALDAIHLASAKLVKGDLGQTMTFASWDADLERAAIQEGFDSLGARRA